MNNTLKMLKLSFCMHGHLTISCVSGFSKLHSHLSVCHIFFVKVVYPSDLTKDYMKIEGRQRVDWIDIEPHWNMEDPI